MPGNVRPVVDERDALCAYLAQARYTLKLTAFGLSDEEMAMAPSPSSLSLGGIVKHVTSVERTWMGIVLGQPRLGELSEYMAAFRVEPGETLDAILADYDRAAAETDEIVAAIPDLGQAVPVPKGVPWFPADVEAWSVRWVLLHLVQETARHSGHADIVRESIDGAGAFPLMAAAEGWPEMPYLKPWRRESP